MKTSFQSAVRFFRAFVLKHRIPYKRIPGSAIGTAVGFIFTFALFQNCGHSTNSLSPGLNSSLNGSQIGQFEITVVTDENLDWSFDTAASSYSLIAHNGFILSTVVAGTCPSGIWNGNLYKPGTLTTNCTLAFAAFAANGGNTNGNTNGGNSSGGNTNGGNTNGTISQNGNGQTGTLQLDHSVHASGANTFISNSAQNITDSGTVTFNVSANGGYTLSNIVAGNCPIPGTWLDSHHYSTGPIIADCNVFFTANQVPISVGLSVSVTANNVTPFPSGTISVNPGSSRNFIIVPDPGFSVSPNPTGNCPQGSIPVTQIPTSNAYSYTTGTIQAACNIGFVGVPLPPNNVTISGTHVDAIPQGITSVPWGNMMTLIVVPHEGEVLSTSADGTCPQGSINAIANTNAFQYIVGPITSDCSIKLKSIRTFPMGGLGSALGNFKHPTGIVVTKNGTIFVSDTDNGRIQKCTASGCINFAPGKFTKPMGLFLDPGEGVFVADAGKHQVIGCTADASFCATSVTLSGSLEGPVSVSKNTSGFLYTADPENNQMIECGQNQNCGQMGNYIPAHTSAVINGIDTMYPHFYMAGRDDHKVMFRGMSGGPYQEIGSGWSNPKFLATDYHGATIYVADEGTNRIVRCPTWGLGAGYGTCIAPMPLMVNGAPFIFSNLGGMWVDYAGLIYVTDKTNNKIYRFTSTGELYP